MSETTIHDGLTGEEVTEGEAVERMLDASFGVERVLDLLPPIFKACVDSEQSRYDLALPWREGDYAYATDGKIIVRTPAKGDRAARIDRARKGRGKTPLGDELYRINDSIVHHREPVSIPSRADRPAPFIACSECLGFGELVDDLVAVSYQCDSCEGMRIVRNGIGVKLSPTFTIAAFYLGLVEYYGACLYLPVKIGPLANQNPALIVEDGDDGASPVVGYVMGMRSDNNARKTNAR
jgi:hypothetical protein